MSNLFASFNFLDRGWDVRALENQSLRSIFVWLAVLLFLLGSITALTLYRLFRSHQFDWSNVIVLLTLAVIVFRPVRVIYRRLGQQELDPPAELN